MFQNAKVQERDRKMTFDFDGPSVVMEDAGPDEKWWERIKVTCTHNADKKQYEAHVSWCKASRRGNFSIEQFAIFSDPRALIAGVPAARYSANKFSAFCTEAQTMCIGLAADEYNVSTAAELLRKAQSFSLVKN